LFKKHYETIVLTKQCHPLATVSSSDAACVALRCSKGAFR